MTIPVLYGQVSIEYTGTNVPTGAANVFGISHDGIVTPGDAAQFFKDKWIARIMPQLTNDVTLSKVRVKFGPDATGAFAEVAANTPGGLDTTSLAPNTAYLVNKSTSSGGRRGRGRMFIPGLAEVDVSDGGIITGGRLTLVDAALANFMADVVASVYDIVVLHSPATVWILDANGQPRRQPTAGAVPAPYLVTSMTAAAKVATQRRRLRR